MPLTLARGNDRRCAHTGLWRAPSRAVPATACGDGLFEEHAPPSGGVCGSARLDPGRGRGDGINLGGDLRSAMKGQAGLHDDVTGRIRRATRSATRPREVGPVAGA